MKSEPQFFLGRSQQTSGPFSSAEIESLRKSGKLFSYSWIFVQGDNQWNPIDPPPSELPGCESTPEVQPLPQTHLKPALRLVRNFSVSAESLRVVLFDHRNAISGWLAAASESGCEIRSEQNGPDPFFVANEVACLSLHDTRSGETVKLRVHVSSIARASNGKGWTYRALWRAVPSLLNAQNQGRSSGVAA